VLRALLLPHPIKNSSEAPVTGDVKTRAEDAPLEPADGLPIAPEVTAPIAPRGGLMLGYALAAAGAILFALKGVLAKFVYAEGLDVETLMAYRMAFSVPFFIAFGALAVWRGGAGRGGKLTPAILLKTAGIGLLGYWFSSYADFLGLYYISPQFERMILFTYPLFVVLFGAVLFGQRPKSRTLIAFAVSYAGLGVVFLKDFSAGGGNVAFGAGSVLAAAIAFAFYNLFAKEMIVRLGAPLFTALAMTAAATGVFVQFALTHEIAALAISTRALWLMLAVAVGATVLPSILMNYGLQRISAQANSMIGTLSPVATLALAVVFLGEVATWVDVVGCLLVMAGVGIYTVMDRRR
jgi:drug/metabolite transporter (DMT)-like permease